MIEIPPPAVSPGNENRHLFCQMAVELPLQDLIESAVKVGWDDKEVLAAGANAEVEALLQGLKRKLE